MLTLRTLLEEIDLGLATGEESADAPVRWVHITELPDPTPWLSGGELILTTGLQLGTAELQREFVRRLADHQLAGLGFGVGFGHDEIPDALVEEAQQAGLPGVRGALRPAVHRRDREGVRAAGERAVRGAPARDRHPQAPGAAGHRGARAGRAGARAGRGAGRHGHGDRRARRADGPPHVPPRAGRGRAGQPCAPRSGPAGGARGRAQRERRAGARAPGGGRPVGGAAGLHARARGAAGVAVRRPRQPAALATSSA